MDEGRRETVQHRPDVHHSGRAALGDLPQVHQSKINQSVHQSINQSVHQSGEAGENLSDIREGLNVSGSRWSFICVKCVKNIMKSGAEVTVSALFDG